MTRRTHKDFRLIYVKGFAIRNTLDDDFGLIHRRSTDLSRFAPKFYIPENEIWVDKPFQDETDFLLKIEFFAEDNNLPPTFDYQREHAEMKRKLCHPTPPPFARRQEALNEFVVVYVDGAVVRQYFDPEFILGGHDLVYDYIPSGQIWLDDKMASSELPYILEHERVERELMAQGKSYESAHDFATAADKELRRRNGVGRYPSEPNYLWRGWPNEKIIAEQYYV